MPLEELSRRREEVASLILECVAEKVLPFFEQKGLEFIGDNEEQTPFHGIMLDARKKGISDRALLCGFAISHLLLLITLEGYRQIGFKGNEEFLDRQRTAIIREVSGYLASRFPGRPRERCEAELADLHRMWNRMPITFLV